MCFNKSARKVSSAKRNKMTNYCHSAKLDKTKSDSATKSCYHRKERGKVTKETNLIL